MAVFGVGFGLSILIACIIINIPLVQSRNRRHGHRSHSDYYNLEESLPRDLSERFEDDSEYYRDFYGQTMRRGYPQVFDHSSEYEDTEERVPSFLHRYKHEYDWRIGESLQRKEDFRKHDDFDAFPVRFVRRKRHNKHAVGNTVSYQKLSEDRKQFHEQHNHGVPRFDDPKMPFELEVKEAQNISICNYTVESIPDTRGSRVPKDLEHVKCNQIGCQDTDVHTYCCIQTYRNIEVSYGDGNTEIMKIYMGCVCAFQILADGLVESQLPEVDY